MACRTYTNPCSPIHLSEYMHVLAFNLRIVSTVFNDAQAEFSIRGEHLRFKGRFKLAPYQHLESRVPDASQILKPLKR